MHEAMNESAETVIVLERLGKRFGDQYALEGIDLQV